LLDGRAVLDSYRLGQGAPLRHFNDMGTTRPSGFGPIRTGTAWYAAAVTWPFVDPFP
jgi:hypothetical protein